MRVIDEDGMPLDGGWLYAVGDVNRRALLTHQGKYQARAAGDAIVVRAAGKTVDDDRWGWHAATADSRVVPQVIFTDPEVAAVGLTATQAERHGFRTKVIDYNLGSVAGAALHADGYTAQDAGLLLFGGAGFSDALMQRAATDPSVQLIGLDRLYYGS